MKRLNIEKFYEFIKNDFFKLGFDEGKPFPHNGVISFYKDKERYVTNFGCGVDTEKKQFFVNQSTYSRIILDEVNSILFRFVENTGNENYTIMNLPNFNIEVDNIKFSYIESEQNIEDVKNILLEYVVNIVLPFFEQIKTVEDVNKKILNAVSFEEYSNYIPGNIALKVIIIMHLCKNEKLNEYYKYLTQQIIDQSNDPEYKDYLYIIESQEKLISDVMIFLKENI